ncbi:EcsC family protein [Blastococcus sp. SYSU D00820]
MADDFEYERAAWEAVQEHKRRQAERSPRRLLPPGPRRAVDELSERLRAFLESAPGAEVFHSAFSRALDGGNRLIGKAAVRTVRRRRIVARYSRHGAAVVDLADIRELPLRSIDEVRPALDVRYALGTFLTGAASGAVAGGGALASTAGAAPGLGVVATAMATDAALTLGAVNRGVAQVAAYYGYDATRPEERLFALGVMNAALAGTGKSAAYAELSQLAQKLVRDATWEKLNEHLLTRVVRKVYDRFGYRLVKRKLAQVVPVVGMLIGGGLNAQLLDSAIEEIDVLYRERLLQDRYGPEGPAGLGAALFRKDADGDEDEVPLVDIIDAEIVEEAGAGD